MRTSLFSALISTAAAFVLLGMAGCSDPVEIEQTETSNGEVGTESESTPIAEPAVELPEQQEPEQPEPEQQQPELPVPDEGDEAMTVKPVAPVVAKSTITTPSEPAASDPRPGSPDAAPSLSQPKPSESIASSQPAGASTLASDVAAFEVPPPWLASVTTQWDVDGKPWKDGRLEIRRLLGKNNEQSRREAIKLMWDYRLKGDMGNGHEYGMYTFLGKEPVWAVIAFREQLAEAEESFQYPPYFAAQGLASILTEYGEFEDAETILKRAATWTPPPPSGRFAKPGAGWVEVRQAESHDALGDLYAAWGRTEQALSHYRDAVRIYPTGNPPYGKHTLPRKAKKVQAKIDLIEGGSLDSARLRNGTYRANTIGYSGDVKLTVTVADGRVSDIKVNHQEKIDQGATKTIPDRIIEQQTLNVDGVTGATVTKDAIISGMLEALRKAGL